MNVEHHKEEEHIILYFIIISVLIYLGGWRIPLMEVDAVQYANISREMLHSGHFLQLFDQGKDYLDKPPMLFWLSTLSMYLLGVNDLAYRLPSFLFAILALFSTYRFALLYYKKQIALLSTLVLASCQAMFLITHDVRTDTMLMGWTMLGIWQLASWYRSKNGGQLILAALAIAGGMMTKGPIALMVPVFAFAPHFILQRSFKQLFRWEYLLLLAIIILALIPMSIGLYQQFDLHPEKTMYGQKATSGIRFYYWTQSFGRITGESTWHENDSFFFLFQNLLWGFLPWTLFFVWGLVGELWGIAKKRFLLSAGEEWISTGGFVITYCALGISKFQLPHYIYIVLPLASIITGKYVYQILYLERPAQWQKPLFIIHTVIFSLMGIALLLLLYFPFPPVNKFLFFLCLLSIVLLLLAVSKKWLPSPALLTMAVLSIFVINIFIDNGFYPQLLQYQSGVKVSSVIREKKLDKDRFFLYKIVEQRSLAFYSNHSFLQVENLDSLQSGDCLLTDGKGYGSVDLAKFKLLYQGESFHVSTLGLGFLNPATRKKNTEPYYIFQRE